MAHETFVVRAELGSPVSLEDPIPFEGILFDVRFTYDPTTRGTPLSQLTMDRGVYRASCGVMVTSGLSGAIFDTIKVTKRIDAKGHAMDYVDAGPHVARGDVTIGEMSEYRPRITEHPTISNVSEILWQVHGDRKAVESMVRNVPSIGRLRKRGLGMVREWSFEDSDGDAAEAGWFGAGRVLRRLPTDIVVERLGKLPEVVMVRHDSLEPPFWDPASKVEVAVPTLRSMIMGRKDAKRALAF